MPYLWAALLLAADAVTWSPPVDAPVVRPFVPGAGAFEAGGHAGLDYRVEAGTPVGAAGDGRVAFAGRVAGATFVVMDHGGGVRTAYGQLAGMAVRREDAVRRGDVLGTAGGVGMGGHAPGVLHFGLRVGGRPVDPALLFSTSDLTALVRLVPVDGSPPEVGSPGVERHRAALWFSPRAGPPAWMRAPLLAELGAGTTGVLSAVGAGLRDWTGQDGCSSSAPPAPRTTHLLVVAGLNSSTRADGSTNALHPEDLGYARGQVTWFSYARDGGSYVRGDTTVGPEVAAARLAAQLRALARRHPGRTVDLLGHSQGGVVIEAFLKDHLAGHEDDYPPIETVVTLAAPHRGATLAALGGEGVRDLAEESPVLARLGGTPLPPDLAVTTIGATGDVFVPAGQTVLAGADHVVVDPAGPADHHTVLTDPGAMAAVRLALAGRPPPCRTLPEAVRDRVVPEVIHAAERVLVVP